MINGNDESTPKSHTCRPFKPRDFPSAGERLIREGFIAPDEYGRMFDVETASWEEILSMDEPALDRELGAVEAAKINEASRRGATNNERPTATGGYLRAVKTVAPSRRLVPYQHHYQMRLAGVRDGLLVSRYEIETELKDVQRLLMATAGGFLFDVFKNLGRYLDDGRLLLVEKLVDGEARLEGCVAYDHQDLICLGGASGLIRRRVNVIRLLAAKDSEHRALLAARLCYEAQLRGTVRAMQPGSGLACIGTLGIIPEVNTRALKWASRLGHRAKILPSRSKIAGSDPVLAAFRDEIDAGPARTNRDMTYRFVIADRMQLLDAARLHLVGIGSPELCQDESDLRLDYEVNDPCSLQILKAATDLADRNEDVMRRFGLLGSHDATIWGPRATADMGVPVTARRSEPNYA